MLTESLDSLISRFRIGQTKISSAKTRAAIKIRPKSQTNRTLLVTEFQMLPLALCCDWLWALSRSMALLPLWHLEYEWCWPYATYYKNRFSPLLFDLLVSNSESWVIYLIDPDEPEEMLRYSIWKFPLFVGVLKI